MYLTFREGIAMKVEQFRALIERAERKVNQDYHACVGTNELVYWFGESFKVFNELAGAECSRATSEDIRRWEIVQDNFCSLAFRNEKEWNLARRKYLDQPNAGMETTDFENCICELKKSHEEIQSIQQNIKTYRSALHHFGGRASEFTVKRWKIQLQYHEEELGSVICSVQEITERAEKLLEDVKSNQGVK